MLRKIGDLRNENERLAADSGAGVCNLTLINVSYFPQTLTFSVDSFQDAFPSVWGTEGKSPRPGALMLIH